MSFTSQSRKVCTAAVVAIIVLAAMVTPVRADVAAPPVLTLRISDTTATEGAENAWFSVYFQNRTDTLAGFKMMVVLNRVDMVEFKADTEDTTIDTTWQYCVDWESGECVEWVDTQIVDTTIISSAIDTTGCLISGWQYVTARPVEGNIYSIAVTAFADKLGPPYRPGLPPQTSEGLLFRLKVRVYDSLDEEPDSIPLPDSVSLVIVDDCSVTGFSDPSGDYLIGTITEHSVCDTTFLECINWDGETCLEWDTTDNIEDADSLVIDSFWVYWYCTEYDLNDSCLNWIDTTEQDADSIWLYHKPWTRRDTLVSFYHDGKLTVDPFSECLCGDANNDGAVNIGDAVFLSNLVFHDGPQPLHPECADMNHHDGSVNVGDVVYLLFYIFKSGAAPDCL
jgi:hypothetical protein